MDEKYRKYKMKYILQKGRSRGQIGLTREGQNILEQWERSRTSEDPDFLTDFDPKDFELLWTGVAERLEVSSIQRSRALNILFISTGMKPYSEIKFIDRIIQSGYSVGKLYFFDPVYTSSAADDILLKVKLPIISALNFSESNIFCLGKYKELLDLIGDDHIDLFIGFNYQYETGVPPIIYSEEEEQQIKKDITKVLEIRPRLVAERERRMENRLDFFVTLRASNPQMISAGIISHADGSVEQHFDLIERLSEIDN